MEINQPIHSLSTRSSIAANAGEDASYSSIRIYSMRHVRFIRSVSQQMTMDALYKFFKICRLVGIKSKHHFKQFFIFDATIGTLVMTGK